MLAYTRDLSRATRTYRARQVTRDYITTMCAIGCPNSRTNGRGREHSQRRVKASKSSPKRMHLVQTLPRKQRAVNFLGEPHGSCWSVLICVEERVSCWQSPKTRRSCTGRGQDGILLLCVDDGLLEGDEEFRLLYHTGPRRETPFRWRPKRGLRYKRTAV